MPMIACRLQPSEGRLNQYHQTCPYQIAYMLGSTPRFLALLLGLRLASSCISADCPLRDRNRCYGCQKPILDGPRCGLLTEQATSEAQEVHNAVVPLLVNILDNIDKRPANVYIVNNKLLASPNSSECPNIMSSLEYASALDYERSADRAGAFRLGGIGRLPF